MTSASRIITMPQQPSAFDAAAEGFGSGGRVGRAEREPGPTLVAGYSARELRLLRDQTPGSSDRIARENPDAVGIAVDRARRILTTRRSRLRQLLDESGLRRDQHRIERCLAGLRSCFFWSESIVEDEETYWLGDAGDLAADVILFLARAEGVQVGRRTLPVDLVDEYVLRQTLARMASADVAKIHHVVRVLFGRKGEMDLERVLGAFVRHRAETRDGGGEREALVSCFTLTESSPSRTRVPIPWTRAAAIAAFLSGVAGIVAFVGGEGIAGLRQSDPRLWASLAACLAILAVGAALENRVALLFAILVGMPIEWPVSPLGDDRDVCRRRAEWLARFLREKPRGYNTAGGHLACGAIAVKRTLKRLCLRSEDDDETLQALRNRRAQLALDCASLHEQLLLAVASAPRGAGELGRLLAARRREIDDIDMRIRSARLRIQARIVETFLEEWDVLREPSRLPRATHATVVAQFQQPGNAPHGLLPDGLVRGPLAVFFDWGMFIGRLALAGFFIGTLHASQWGWALVLLLLQLYVIEPVILKIHIAWLGLMLDAPGHKMTDLRRYLDESVPAGGVFLVPITVPKFSSNPLITALNAVITAASERSGVRVARVIPLSMSAGRRDTVLELEGSAAQHAGRIRAALERELARERARLPMDSAVTVQGSRVVVTLLGGDDAIWKLVGEDADQAFVHLWRTFRALRDTLRHLGPKFRPVFVLASNTKDPDVVDYEVEGIRRLQAYSNQQHGAQVGFLYLLHGGEWLDFNAHRRRFDASDPNLVKAMPMIARRLADPDLPARAYLARALEGARDAAAVAGRFNAILADRDFYRAFEGHDLAALPSHLRPAPATLDALERRRAGKRLGRRAQANLNRELLLTALPLRVRGDFFKKVGNDIPVQELLVTGRTRPSVYVQRARSEHVQDPAVPNYRRAWGDFARYTGLRGTTAEITAKILAGQDVEVGYVPRIGAVIDDKNDFGPGEIEKAIATMLHPDNAHIVMGVPSVQVTLPELAGRSVSSDYILASKAAREMHNVSDSRVRARIFSGSTPAYGKWWKRLEPYFSHYREEVLNPAHSLSHDFQQSYLVAGASNRLSGFAEALTGPSRFRIQAVSSRTSVQRPAARSLAWGLLLVAAVVLIPVAMALRAL
jgi:hypothetical protein